MCDGCVHTLTCCTHIFLVYIQVGMHFAHSYACYTHAWLGSVCSAHVVISLSSHLLLLFHPSVFLLFLDCHFESTPDYDLADFDVHDFLPNFSDPKAQVKRTPHEFGYLTVTRKRAFKTEKRRRQKCSSSCENCTSIGLCLAGLRAVPKRMKYRGVKFWINSTGTIHSLSSKYPRK